MAHISYPFKKTSKAVYQKPASVVTEDNIYWKKLGVSVHISVDYFTFMSKNNVVIVYFTFSHQF